MKVAKASCQDRCFDVLYETDGERVTKCCYPSGKEIQVFCDTTRKTALFWHDGKQWNFWYGERWQGVE